MRELLTSILNGDYCRIPDNLKEDIESELAKPVKSDIIDLNPSITFSRKVFVEPINKHKKKLTQFIKDIPVNSELVVVAKIRLTSKDINGNTGDIDYIELEINGIGEL